MLITETEKNIVMAAEEALEDAGTHDIPRLLIQRAVGLIVSTSCQQHKVEQLTEARDFIQSILDDKHLN